LIEPVYKLVVHDVAGLTWRGHCTTWLSGFDVEQAAAAQHDVTVG
jgi:hypothetical protein